MPAPLVLRQCLEVPRSELDDEDLAATTLVAKTSSALAKPAVLKAHVVRRNTVFLPKAWGLQRFEGTREIVDAQDPDGGPEGSPESERGLALHLPQGLRPAQAAAVDAAVEVMRGHPMGGGCLVVLPCGFGKTVAALAVAHRMRARPLVLVHTETLQAQWADRIRAYCPGSNIGLVRQDRADVGPEFTHVIASVQSLVRRRYEGLRFRLMIVDECHRICAPQLSRAVVAAGTRWRLGLSATPDREDGLAAFLSMAIGPVAYEAARPREDTADLRVYAVRLDDGPVKDRVLRVKNRPTANISAMLNDICDEENPRRDARTRCVVRWIAKCIAKRRRVLVLSDRIAALHDVEARFGEARYQDVLRAKLGRDPTVAYVVGQRRKRKRDAAGGAEPDKDTADVLLATYGAAAEGMDQPTLDTLVLLTPRSGRAVMTQAVGRLLRQGGRSPLVLDIVDKAPAFQRMFLKRRGLYETIHADVTHWSENGSQIPENPSETTRAPK